jgi:hypothetical protein
MVAPASPCMRASRAHIQKSILFIPEYIYYLLQNFSFVLANGIHHDKGRPLITKMASLCTRLHGHDALLMADSMTLESSKSDN